MNRLLLSVAIGLVAHSVARASESGPSPVLTPLSGADGLFDVVKDGTTTAVRGREVSSHRYPLYLYFRVPDAFRPARGPVYVEVEYRDLGRGKMGLQYNARSPREESRNVALGYGRFLTGSGAIGRAVFELADPEFRHAQNLGADLRLVNPDTTRPLHVLRATIQAEPTALFRAQNAPDWLGPYRGPTRSDVDASTLHGKVLCGYQGWFRCPGDPAGQGWVHWSREPAQVAPRTLTVEMWPDMSAYPESERYPVPGFRHRDGQAATLFSAADPRTVERHFEWMKTYGIDGAIVQRFVVGLGDRVEITRVLAAARAAANRTGRVFMVEYDMTQEPNATVLEKMLADWKWLVDDLKLTDDARYLHQDGRPVLAIFGFYKERMDAGLARRIVDAFRADGRYRACLVGGCPWEWRKETDPAWAELYRKFDVISPWNVGNVAWRGTKRFASMGSWAGDLAETRRNGQVFLPVVYPGFAWDNLMRLPPGRSVVPRMGGAFFWDQFVTLRRMGIDTAFVAMFDEVDEGTAIFKVTSDPPSPGHFATFDGLPSDWYLRLAGEGARLIRGERPLTTELPIK